MDPASYMQSNSNKYVLKDYEAPHWPGTSLQKAETTATAQPPDGAEHQEEEEVDAQEDCVPLHQSFTIRHLKQGATGAVRTWPAAQVLLDYLVCHGGLLGSGVAARRDEHGSNTVLDLSAAPSAMQQASDAQQIAKLTASHCYHVMELGAGSGFLGVGLSLAMNHEACRRFNSRSAKQPFQPRIRIMCTDNDKTTIKNMRHNIVSQPRARNVAKAVKVESLDWGNGAVEGVQFSNAIRSFFSKRQTQSSADDILEEDPLNLLTHIVASDVHYGETSLEPLSEIVAAVKLRSPKIVVILLLRERSPNAVADLKLQIEEKVLSGLEGSRIEQQLLLPEEAAILSDRISAAEQLRRLQDFSVSVRDVTHQTITNMKMVEC